MGFQIINRVLRHRKLSPACWLVYSSKPVTFQGLRRNAIGYLSESEYALSNHAPGLRQVFFVGDGLTGTGSGSVQTFAILDGAGILVLGFAAAFAFSGDAGWYGDNVGGYDVDYGVVPEPMKFGMVAGGACCPRSPQTLAGPSPSGSNHWRPSRGIDCIVKVTVGFAAL